MSEIYAVVRQLEPNFQQMAHPADVLSQGPFREGVGYFVDPWFSSADLLEYATGDNELMAYMALEALSKRETDPDLAPGLLKCFAMYSPWRQFFVLRALASHASASDPLVGELLFLIRNRDPHAQMLAMQFMKELVVDRAAAGEEITLGPRLDQLDEDAAKALASLLESAKVECLEPLNRELQKWSSTHIDRDFLRSTGRFWGEESDQDATKLIAHPDLDEQMKTVRQTLAQNPPRSTLVVGEHGVGKSAVVKALGSHLLEEGWIIFEASPLDLVAGQMYVGQLEERLKQVITQLGRRPHVLWYIPDFAALQWVGKHMHSQSGALDNILPAIEKGQIVVVGEIDQAAFEQLVQANPRCQSAVEVCRIPALDEKPTLDLARKWIKVHTEGRPQSIMSEKVLLEAWQLAQQYLQDRAAPGSLLGFLDTTRQRLSTGNHGKKIEITTDDLIVTLAKLTGLPASILDDRQRLDRSGLTAFFHKRIQGQDEAIECLVERITLIKAGLTDPTRPQGVFLFAGPSGTGKTEIAKALATYLFGSPNRLIRMDMSEFQVPESLDRLFGEHTGGEQHSLANQVRRQPFSIILLDEFEKAHPRVWDVFLQVFDDGRLTDKQGFTADFRHTIIILTSNLGAGAPRGKSVGFSSDHQGFYAGDVDRAIGKAFRKEFLNRLDRVVVFRPFTREVMRQILAKEIEDVQSRRGLRNRSWAIVWEGAALDFLLDKGFSPELGARPLKRAIERFFLTPLAVTIVNRQVPEGDQFLYVNTDEDRLAVEFIDPDEPVETTSPAVEATGAEQGKPDASLEAIVLDPRGTPAEIKALQAHFAEREAVLSSSQWEEEKELCLSMMALPDFWDSPERFPVLGEVEYRDRISTGLKAAGALLDRLVDRSGGGRQHYPPKLVGQVAQSLFLLRHACQSLEEKLPWEVFLQVEATGQQTETPVKLNRFAERLGQMYRSWAKKRKMRCEVLSETRGRGPDPLRLLMSVSGFGALSLLRPEQGLHVWEVPQGGSQKSFRRYQALVRVVPQPEDLGNASRNEQQQAATKLFQTTAAGAPAIVRYYREMPSPLVRDRIRDWRTGHLDRVLGGDFDLF
jgi:ATP-dependent Clp protease ATP-binding subunit ClpC